MSKTHRRPQPITQDQSEAPASQTSSWGNAFLGSLLSGSWGASSNDASQRAAQPVLEQVPAESEDSTPFWEPEARSEVLDSYAWGRIGALRSANAGGVVLEVYGEHLAHLDPADIKAGFWRTTLDQGDVSYMGEVIDRRGPQGVKVWFPNLGIDQAKLILKDHGRDLDLFALWA